MRSIATVDGRQVTLDDAINRAAELLVRARLPLVYGFEHATVEAQRLAVEIADLLGAAIDQATSAGHAASFFAFQRIGQVSATLGEVRRADLVVYWGIDPDDRHPGFRASYVGETVRHVEWLTDRIVEGKERLAKEAAGRRFVVAVDVGGACGPEQADERFEVAAESEFDALWSMRARLRGRRIEERANVAGTTEPRPYARLDGLVARLRNCRYGVILHDADPPRGRRDPLLPLALGALVLEANRTARVRLIGVRRPGNAVGAETVLTWQTGFPGAVDFGRGYPRYGPGEFTAERLLAQAEADAALLVGANAPLDLSANALDRLERIPSVVVGGPGAWSGPLTRVRIATPPFETLGGSVYRMDGIALRRRSPALEPADAAVLGRISASIRQRLALAEPR